MRAYDSLNNTAVSAIVDIKVFNTLTAAITFPLNNDTLNSDFAVTIQASASGGKWGIQKVEFFADTVYIGKDSTNPYSFTWNKPAAGYYALTVKAYDSLNNTVVSAIVDIRVLDTLTASITFPLNNDTINSDFGVTIQTLASRGKWGIQKVEFFADTVYLGKDSTSPYSFTWNNPVAGNYALTAKVIDSINNSVVSEIINIIVIDTLTAAITFPLDNDTINSDFAVTIQTLASGGKWGIQKVEFFADTVYLGEDSISPYSFTWNKPAARNYALTAKVIDSLNNSIVSEIINIIVIDTLTAAITFPLDNDTINTDSAVTIQTLASGGKWGIKKVEFFADTVYLGEDSISPYSFTWNNPAAGNYGLTAKVIDSLNNSVVSEIINFTVIAASKELVSLGGIWKYQDNGTNQGTEWKEIYLNDTTWKTGYAEFGYGDSSAVTLVSFGPSATNKYITTYFRKTFEVTDKSTISGLELSLIRDDGAVVYINGIEAYRNNLPAGTIYYNTLAPSIIDERDESVAVKANLSSASLVDGTNLIAVEIHQNAVTSEDISFNLKLSTMSGLKNMDIPHSDSIQQKTILENTYDMIVYPNPNTGQFTLELCVEDLQEKTLVIEVSDSFGTVVYQNQPKKIDGCIKEAIELKSSLPVGIYWMKVTIEGKTQTSKILLTK